MVRIGLIVAAVGLALASLAAPASAARARAATVRDGAARFEVLSPTLIRVEYAADGRFENGSTMTVPARRLPRVRFKTYVRGGARFIRTSALTLRYRRGSGSFTAGNLSIALHGRGVRATARPDWTAASNPQNLGGWRRALDDESGPVPLHDGLLSRAGWYLLNDSET